MKIFYYDPEVYPATHNFRDDEDNTDPDGWTTANGASCTSTIIALHNSHRKVLKCVDGSAATSYDLNITFPSQTIGTIELWFETTDNSKINYIVLYDAVPTLAILVDLNAIAGVGDNTMYHYRIKFDTGADTYDHYLNGSLIASSVAFDNNSAGIVKLRLTADNASLVTNYFDAIGFSWDTDYKTGDNGFWRHYKDQDSDFENEEIGTEDTDISFIDSATTPANTHVKIIAQYNEHKKVLEIYDNNGGGDADARHSIDSPQVTGSMEFYWETSDVTKTTNFIVMNQAAGISIFMKIDASKFQFNDGGWNDVGKAAVNNTTYHLKLIFNCATDNYDIWIDNVRYQQNAGFSAVATTLNTIRIVTDSVPSGYYSWFDAFSFSWTSGNEIGDNLKLVGDWIELTTIKMYPEPRNRMDETSQISFTLNDFEGALYSKWSEHNFIEIRVEDNSEIILFRGYLTGKKFTRNKLVCTAHGLSVRLDWIPLKRDYVEAFGLVKTIPYAGGDVPNVIDTTIEPDGDVDQNWVIMGGEATSWESVVDDSDVTLIVAGDGFEDVVDEWSLTTITATEVQQVVVTIRGFRTGSNSELFCDLFNGVGWEGYEGFFLGTGITEAEVTFSGLTMTQAHLNAAKIRIKAAAAYGVTDFHTIYKVSTEITFTGDTAETLELETNDEALLNWIDDRFSNDADMGILIVDNTGNIDTLTFEATGNPTLTNGTYVSGDKEGLDTKYDGLTYVFKDTATPHDAYITVPTGDAVGIADTQTLHKIEINYRIGVFRTWFLFGLTPPTKITIKILDDDNYDNNAFIIYESSDASGSTEWIEGVLTIEDSDTNLQKFLVNDAGDYKSLTGLRVYLEGWALNLPATVYVDLLDVTIYYAAVEAAPIMEQIDHNGAEYVRVHGLTWSTTALTAGDSFKIGPISSVVLSDIFIKAGVNYQLQSTLTHYIAQDYRGTYCKEILKKICLLEGLHWWEDHPNNRVVISAEVDFVDSTEDLSQVNYDQDWEFEDDGNHYGAIEVYGKASLKIYYYIEDLTINSPRIKVIIEETITTLPEAKEVGDSQLAEFQSKRPSIKIPLTGVYENLKVGNTVGLTMVRPTVAEADYPIRMTERSKFGDAIKTIIYCGLGYASVQEKIANDINKAMLLAHQAHTDRLTAQ